MGAVALRDQTASRLVRRLGETPGVPGVRGAGAGGGAVVLVRCTDDTPAGATGVGAECYPAVVVRPQASVEVGDQEDAGEVWLTALSGPEAVEPTAGALYWCVLAGPVEVDGSARPRAFGVGPRRVLTGYASSTVGVGYSGGTWASTGVTVLLPTAGVYFLSAGIEHYYEINIEYATPGTKPSTWPDFEIARGWRIRMTSTTTPEPTSPVRLSAVSERFGDGNHSLPPYADWATSDPVKGFLGLQTTAVYVTSGSEEVKLEAAADPYHNYYTTPLGGTNRLQWALLAGVDNYGVVGSGYTGTVGG